MKIGFIGLGNMGSGMVKNLVARGFSVLGYDSDESKLTEPDSLGHEKAQTVSDIAMSCELVILCLPNPASSRSVIFDQLLTEDSCVSTIIETSTLDPETVKDFAEMLQSQNKQFLSAPMIGGKSHAQNATIEFLVEGSQKVFEDNQNILNAMGSKCRFMGDVPSATLAKLAFNLSRYANLAVGVETHRLLDKYHANVPAIYDFMSEQSLDNFGQVWKEDLKEMMTNGVVYVPSQVPKKDLALLLSMAEAINLDDELIKAIRNTYLSME